MSNLAFFAADTLGLTLYQLPDALKGHEVRRLKLGPWHLELEVEAVSDIITPNEISFWMTVAKKLRMYAIVREKESWLVVLDEKALKEVGAATGFAAKKVRDRVIEIKPAIKGLFRWDGSRWGRIEVTNGLAN